MPELEMEPLSKTCRNENNEHETTEVISRRISTWQARLSGWRGGIFIAIVISFLILLLNITLAITAATKWGLGGGIATAFTGNCKRASWITTALHLLINVLSSLLLGASNYCMQRLAAPSRKEIDKAHAKRKWLDVGVPNIRNLTHISNGRVSLWVLLGLSSLPLHLLYNSVVFETIAANNVDFLVISPEFFTDKGSWHLRPGQQLVPLNETYINQLQDSVLDGKFLDRTRFENLTGPDCSARYLTQTFITNAGTGFAVLDLTARDAPWLNTSGSLIASADGTGVLNDYLGGIVGVNGEFLLYCLSQVVEQKCQVQLSFTILLVVIACNIIKLILLPFVLLGLSPAALVTIGDAIDSFLQRPDPTTEDCCLMSRRNVDALWRNTDTQMNQTWQPRHREPWFGACSRRRWMFLSLLYIATIIIAGILLSIAHKHEGGGRNGFGEPNTENMIKLKLPFSESIIPYVLMANLPQTIISFLYLTYNGLFTSMLAEREWARYTIKRAPLRVTVPRLGQRSTYFLHLPYTWGVPLLISSILLHWFISQSIFLVRIAVYKNGVPMSDSTEFTTLKHETYDSYSQSGNVFTGVGYSDVGLVISICWGTALVVISLLVAGICTYPKGFLIGGTNSAVISAACHLKYETGQEEQGEEEVTEKPLMWGVTIQGDMDKTGHCCFTDKEVQAPRLGYLYAGVVREKWD